MSGFSKDVSTEIDNNKAMNQPRLEPHQEAILYSEWGRSLHVELRDPFGTTIAEWDHKQPEKDPTNSGGLPQFMQAFEISEIRVPFHPLGNDYSIKWYFVITTNT